MFQAHFLLNLGENKAKMEILPLFILNKYDLIGLIFVKCMLMIQKSNFHKVLNASESPCKVFKNIEFTSFFASEMQLKANEFYH